jgi:hypothetical protein
MADNGIEGHVRRRDISTVLAVAACGLAILGVASAFGSVNLHDGGDLHEGIGQGDTKPLQHGVIYQASAFPVSLRLRPPDGNWEGVQFESGRFGFVQLHHLRTGNVPLHAFGYITVEAARGSTPSAEVTIRRLHATPHIDASSIKAARVGTFAGQTFDATIVGSDRPPICKTVRCARGVSFAPFTTNHHCGFCNNTMKGETKDVKFAGTGQLFRIIVADVRGKTIVIYLESNFADQPKFPPARIFPTFLPYARQMLSTLTFAR